MSLTSLERRRMSLDDFLALPDNVRAEFVDGEAIMTPPGAWSHQAVAFKVAMVVKLALTDVVVAPEAGVRTGPTKFRVADVAVAEAMPHTVRKSTEYAAIGIGQYLIVDREAVTLTVYANNDAGWDVLLELDQDRPRGSVRVADHGTVELDLVVVLGP